MAELTSFKTLATARSVIVAGLNIAACRGDVWCKCGARTGGVGSRKGGERGTVCQKVGIPQISQKKHEHQERGKTLTEQQP